MEVTVYQGLLEFNWNLLLSMITVFVLYLILKKFFFEKVDLVLMARQAQMEEQLNHAAQQERKAEVLLEEYSRTLAHAEEEKRNILRQARQEADLRAAGIVEKAKQEAEELTLRTHEKLAQEEEKLLHQLQQDMAELAVLAAGRILEREIKAADHADLVSKAVEEAKTAKWEMH